MPRTRNVEQQRQQLSAATWSVLTEHGLTGLTVRAVAERAGCTTGLVFHTFPTKQDLLVHARKLLFDRAAARVEKAEKRAGDPRGALREVAITLLTLGRDGSEEARVWISFLAAALAEPDLAQHHVAGNRALLRRLARLARAAQPRWPPQRARAFAMELAALTEGFNVLSIFDPQRYPRRAQIEAVDRMLEALDG